MTLVNKEGEKGSQTEGEAHEKDRELERASCSSNSA